MTARDFYNKKLSELVDNPDAPRLLAENYIPLRDLVVNSEYTNRFCQENLPKHADGEPENLVDWHNLFMHWVEGFIEELARTLDALGDSALAAEVRRRQDQALIRDSFRPK